MEGTPPGTPFPHPHSEQRQPARAHAVGLVLGPQPRADRTQDKRVAEARLPAPEDRQPGEGQRLTSDAPHNGGRPPPRGRPLTAPTARSPHRACRPRGQCWAPTPTHPRPQHVGGRPQQPAQWAGRESFIVISTLCVCCASPAACCRCRVSCCLFLMRKMFCLLKYNQSRIAQARDRQVEENHDQHMKGWRVNSQRC